MTPVTLPEVIAWVMWAAVAGLAALFVYGVVGMLQARRARHRRHRAIIRRSIAEAQAGLLLALDRQAEVDKVVAELDRYALWARSHPEEFRAALRHWLGNDHLAARRAFNESVEQAIEINRDNGALGPVPTYDEAAPTLDVERAAVQLAEARDISYGEALLKTRNKRGPYPPSVSFDDLTKGGA